MNYFFCSIGQELVDKIDPVPNPLLTGDYVINRNTTIFNFKTIEARENRAAFTNIKTAKSFGVDTISSYFLKLALPVIENSMAFMFNTSIQTSQFPD